MIAQDGRWVIRNVYGDERTAISRARAMVHTERMAESIRVLEHRTAPNGFTTEKELLLIDRLEAYRRQEFQVGKVDEIETCQNYRDLFKPDARRAMEKLLRPYLGVQSLTPTEFLHIVSYHREIDRQGRLVEAGLHVAARLQADSLGLKTPERYEQLSAMAREVQVLAQDFAYEAKSLPKIDGKNFGEVADAIRSSYDAEKAQFFTAASVCMYLMQHRAMLDKLERLVTLLGSSDKAGIAIMDSIFADAISSPGLMRDMLGPQISLADHIGQCMKVIRGEYGTDGTGARFLTAVSHLISGGLCPEAGEAIRMHLVKAFCSNTPLDRRETDPMDERRKLERIAYDMEDDPLLEPDREQLDKAIDQRRRRLRSDLLRQQGLEELADQAL
ncbi:MAG: hypothetical protein KI792_00285 [Alphaproteobacteria bacterium]|nr:hypothetical protein [Alphaproteobacteria bacterium SS10]